MTYIIIGIVAVIAIVIAIKIFFALSKFIFKLVLIGFIILILLSALGLFFLL